MTPSAAFRAAHEAAVLATSNGGNAVTGDDQAFKRPSPADGPQPADTSVQDGAQADPEPAADSRVLDPDFHQGVWKPWQADPVEHSSPEEHVPSPDAPSEPASRSKASRPLWIAVGAVALLLVGALTLPTVLQPNSPEPNRNPIINDLVRSPVVSWSADYGDVCLPLDPNHVVLSDTDRVWSLDLRTGETLWTSGIKARYSSVDCLPGANMVAVTETTATGSVISITLLDGFTGDRVSGFSGQEAVEVVPLGENVGLVAPDHTLSMFAVDDLASPLWTRDLPGPEGRLQELWVEYIDDITVRLLYSITNTIEDASPQQSVTLSVLTGEVPAWANDDPSVFNRQRLGDVILLSGSSMDTFADDSGTGEFVTATDLEGRELWRQKASPTVAGSRLFLATQSGTSQPWSRLQEVDSRTGVPVGDDSFEGEFRYVFTTAAGRPVLFQGDDLSILDDDLQPLPPVAAENFLFLFQGSEQMYLGRNIDASGEAKLVNMTAIDTSTSKIVWEFELGWGQNVEQLGQHLVLVDADGETIHGLESPGK